MPLPDSIADRRLNNFKERYGPDLLKLAAHAALPAALSPKLLHFIRLNCLPHLPYSTESHLLLSPICYEIGDNLYEIEPAIRQRLLYELQCTLYENAEEQIEEGQRKLAALLYAYTCHFPAWNSQVRLQQAQRLTALYFINPTEAQAWLTQQQANPQSDSSLDKAWAIAMQREIDHLLQDAPNEVAVGIWWSHAQEAEAAGDWQMAANRCLFILRRLDPKHHESIEMLKRILQDLLNRGQEYVKQNDLDQAKTNFEAGLKFAQQAEFRNYQIEFENALDRLNPEPRLRDYMAQAQSLIRQGQGEQAKAILLEALAFAKEVGNRNYQLELTDRLKLVDTLIEWQQRLTRELETARRISRDGKLQEALALLDQLKSDLPDGPVFDPLRQQVTQVRREIEFIPQQVPGYAPEQFINREAEIQKVLERVQALLAGRHVDNRAITFTGARGIGKSWLLAHLRQRLTVLNDLTVVYVNLADYVEPDSNSTVKNILESILDMLGEPYSPNDNLYQLARLSSLSKGRILILLLDSVFEHDDELLKALEDNILQPLLLQKQALIVIAGSGRHYPWRAIELRGYEVTLGPFDLEQTQMQLEYQVTTSLPQAQKFYHLSQGNPLANYLLATQLASHGDFSRALDFTIDQILSTIPAQQRPEIRVNLEALCVLRYFVDEDIPIMLAAYDPQNKTRYENWPFRETHQIRDQLVRFGFAEFSTDYSGYVITGGWRHMMEKYLELTRPDLWRRLHRTAIEMYQDAGADFQQEVEYHQQRLQAGPPGPDEG